MLEAQKSTVEKILANFKKCEDPFKKHKTSVKTNLHEVTLDEFKHSLHNYCVLPGQKLFRRCFKECNESKGEPDIIMHEITYETEMSFEEACDVTNKSLRLLYCSPLKKHVRTDRAFNHGKRKIKEFTKKFRSAVAVALTEPDLENEDCNSCLSRVKDIKEKRKICNKQETVQLLTIGKEQGILAVPKGYSREAEEETKVKVKEFFERDVSRLCLRKKDCVSVKLEDGRKDKVQKRLLLSNLKKIYQHFVTENPALKVGFSAFAMLRPQWYVPVGSSGTYNVCVCTYHQNVKLMLGCRERS